VPLYHLLRDDPAYAQRELAERRAQLDQEFDVFHLLLMSRSVDCLLYCGSGTEAFSTVSSLWKDYEASIISRASFFDSMAQFLRGRAAAAANVEQPSAAVAEIARGAARRLMRRHGPVGLCLGRLLLASLAAQSGDVEEARRLLTLCVDSESEHQMPAFSLYAKRGRASLDAGADAPHSMAEIDATLSARGIANPQRWVRMLLPGFDPR